MSKYITKYSAANLLEQLRNQDLATDEALSDFVIEQQEKKELPLYLQILVCVGAFITSLCFIGFLNAADIINFSHEIELIIWGLIFVAGAIGLQRVAGHDNTVKQNFFMQSSFTSMAVGKVLFVFGIVEAIDSRLGSNSFLFYIGQILDSDWGASLGLLIITGMTYSIYRVSIDRFLSSFAVLLTLLVNILWERDFSASREFLLNGFFLFQFIGAVILLTHTKIKHDTAPLSYAFVFSLCASVLFLASHAEFGYWENKELIHPTFINMVLTGGLIALFVWVAGGIEKLKAEPLVLAALSAILLGLISAPGILLTIGLMILGYAKHEKPLVITGALLMPIFLWLYYFNLDISLLQKSGILIGSGILLLAGRIYLKHKCWDKGGASCVQE